MGCGGGGVDDGGRDGLRGLVLFGVRRGLGGHGFGEGLILDNVRKGLGGLCVGCGLSWRWSLGGLVHCREVDLVQLLADIEEGGLEDHDVLKRLEVGHLLDGQSLPGGDEHGLH